MAVPPTQTVSGVKRHIARSIEVNAGCVFLAGMGAVDDGQFAVHAWDVLVAASFSK